MYVPVFAQEQPAVVDSSQEIAQHIVDSEIPVLLDFWASWCKPCHMLDPVIKKIGKKYKGQIEVIKVNVDIHRGLAAYFKIQSIPSVFIVNEKTVVKFLPGVQPEEAYITAVDEVLAGETPDREPAE